MERLSHDLNLALEESNCGRNERRKIGLRRRTRSAGNLPEAVSVCAAEDGSSSSGGGEGAAGGGGAPLVTQPLSDSDEGQGAPHKPAGAKPRHFANLGNFESDSFNENFSPTRPVNARRKRKFKKMPVEYMDGNTSPPIEILSVTTECGRGASPPGAPVAASGAPAAPAAPCGAFSLYNHKPAVKTERNAFCGKRKWSHREREGAGETRERSFSGGSAYFRGEARARRREPLLRPGRIALAPPVLGAGPAGGARRGGRRGAARGGDSSSLSSSESEGAGAAGDGSDREGDDELTDWPGIEDLKVFNRSLTFRAPHAPRVAPAAAPPAAGPAPPALADAPPPKRLKQERVAEPAAPAASRGRVKKKRAKAESGNEDDAAMAECAGGAEDGGGREVRAAARRGGGGGAGGAGRAALRVVNSEPLARFLRDAHRAELRLPGAAGGGGDVGGAGAAAVQLRSLASMYSLELRVERGQPVLRKTTLTPQAAPPPPPPHPHPPDHKRRCYGGEESPPLPVLGPPPPLLDPGDLD